MCGLGMVRVTFRWDFGHKLEKFVPSRTSTGRLFININFWYTIITKLQVIQLLYPSLSEVIDHWLNRECILFWESNSNSYDKHVIFFVAYTTISARHFVFLMDWLIVHGNILIISFVCFFCFSETIITVSMAIPFFALARKLVPLGFTISSSTFQKTWQVWHPLLF